MAFAATTEVPVAKTKTEIEAMLRKRKATAVGSFEQQGRATLVFEMNDRRIRFELPLPSPMDREHGYSETGKQRSADATMRSWEQACRSRWRALLLCLKAKLESIESGIESFDTAFLAHIQLDDGYTVGEHAAPVIREHYISGKMPPLLPAPKGNA
jgi:hypothetical protein